MTLLEWMKENKKRTADVAIIVGASEETVVSWKMGRSTPQLRFMIKIKAMTKGIVNESSFPPTHDRRPRILNEGEV